MQEVRKDLSIQKWTESVDSELYEELLNRYERVLVFAGQLQEKTNQQKLLVEAGRGLELENHRLRTSLSLSEAYIRLLEGALGALGVIDSARLAGSDGASGVPDGTPAQSEEFHGREGKGTAGE